jgi:hypothetical protein
LCTTNAKSHDENPCLAIHTKNATSIVESTRNYCHAIATVFTCAEIVLAAQVIKAHHVVHHLLPLNERQGGQHPNLELVCEVGRLLSIDLQGGVGCGVEGVGGHQGTQGAGSVGDMERVVARQHLQYHCTVNLPGGCFGGLLALGGNSSGMIKSPVHPCCTLLLLQLLLLKSELGKWRSVAEQGG